MRVDGARLRFASNGTTLAPKHNLLAHRDLNVVLFTDATGARRVDLSRDPPFVEAAITYYNVTGGRMRGYPSEDL